MSELSESVTEYGVLVPGIVRMRASGGYEMVAGHRRKRACELAGLKKMPVIIKDLTDDEATVIMVDSNIQREELLISEKAFAYKMKYETLKRQGKRSDLTSCQVGKKLAVEEVSQNTGDSSRQILRYIHLLEKRKNDWRIDMELTINDLSKEYGRKKAVNHFSVKLTNGVYGLLGANGAGKTTLMRMICDVQTETKGAIFFNGKNIHDLGEKYRNILGYLPQNFGYYPNFTAYKFLMYISAIKGLPPKKAHNRTMELLQVVDLLTQKNEKIKTFSGGMKQRLGIAQALLNDPRILILDEPTAGLDPKERVRFRNLISSLAENRIVILSTHIVSDVEYIANEILIMKNGELIQHGSPEKLLKPIEKCVWECDVSRKEAEELELNYVTANLKHNNGAERLRIISQEAPCRTAWNVDPTLEDLYLYYFAEVSEHE